MIGLRVQDPEFDRDPVGIFSLRGIREDLRPVRLTERLSILSPDAFPVPDQFHRVHYPVLLSGFFILSNGTAAVHGLIIV